jgi:hypothetical protein
MIDFNIDCQKMGKLTDYLSRFQPTVIIGAFCYSNLQTGDVKLVLKERSIAAVQSRAQIQSYLAGFVEEMMSPPTGRCSPFMVKNLRRASC